MLAMAQKSPMAGLTQMGAAINKYQEAHQGYPTRLLDLYPQYIPSREFITKIQWEYQPGNTDFYLSKSMVVGDKTRFASVTSTLVPQLESAVMVAAKGAKGRDKDKAAQKTDMLSTEEYLVHMAANQALAKQQEDAYRSSHRNRKAPVIPLVKETISFEEVDEADLARANILEGRYYCWKNEDGSFGYSNIQYPDRRKVEKFNAGRWMVVQTEFNQRPQAPTEVPADADAVALAALDRHKDRNLILWRDSKGRIGYGNVQYPQAGELEQYEAGRWRDLETLSAELDAASQTDQQPVDADTLTTAEIGAQYSGDYMVWQDESGHVGFSNVQYPQRQTIQHYQEGQWVAVTPARRDTGAGSEAEPAHMAEGMRGDGLAAASSQEFIVWRDANGHIGISNVQLPTSSDQLEVHMDGEWLAAAR
jgi:hypothetical protein